MGHALSTAVHLPTLLAYLGCALVWSTTWYAIRVCIAPGGYPTFAAAALRFAIAAVILVAVRAAMVARGRGGPGPSGARRGFVALAGLLAGLSYGLVYAAETRISGGLAAAIFGTLPLCTAVLTFVTRTEKLSAGAVAGALVAFAGIVIIYRDRMEVSATQATGVAMMFASVLACAVYNLVLKRNTRELDPIATNTTFIAAAAAGLGVFALVNERLLPPWPPPALPTLALLYLAIIGSVVVFVLYFYLLKRMRLMALSTLVVVEPVIAMLIDAAWEHEIRLGAAAYVGAAVTLAGVALSLLGRARA